MMPSSVDLRLPLCLLWLAGCAAGCGKTPVAGTVDYSQANSVSALLENPVKEKGLHLVEAGKTNRTVATTLGGMKCRQLKHRGHYGYIPFRIDPSFKRQGLTNVLVTVDYFDSSLGELDIEYDARESDTPDRGGKKSVRLVVYQHGEYTPTEEKSYLKKSQQWEQAKFHLTNVRFENSQDGNADFRLRISASEFNLRQISLQIE